MLWSPEEEQNAKDYYDSQEFWREGPTSPLITNDPDKRYFAEESGGGYIPPGPPPPLDVTAPKADLTEGMPQLYKKPSADQNIPPGPRPPESGGADSVDQGDPGEYQNTERAKFIEVLKKQIGFDPMSYDPVGTAFVETKQEFLKRYGPDYLLSEGTKKMFREKMQDRMMEYVPKKQQGENAMKFALEQFDKEMGWKSVGTGLAQPGTGKKIDPTIQRATPAGLDDKGRLVVKDATGAMTYADTKEPYAGGQLQPITKPASVENREAKEKSGFMSWTPEAKTQAFSEQIITGKPPVSAAGLGGNNRQEYDKAYQQWKVDNGLKPADIALMQSDYKAGDMSLRNMKKQEAPMEAFVQNINRQISKVEELYQKDDRVGLRLIDLPVRELRVRAKGSGDEAVKASYLLEISNEIGKLSSGASASVQQLSDSAKEDWKKVHDPNLSFSEIMKVVNATRDQANMRLETWKGAGEQVRQMISSLGVAQPGKESAPPVSMLREGFATPFGAKGTWTLKNGKAVRVD